MKDSKPWVIPVFLAGITLLVYSSVGQHAFISYDDPLYVTSNPRVISGLSWQNVFWALTALDIGNWHPLTWLSHLLDVELFGLSAAGHHWISAGIHAANAALLFWVLNSMTKVVWPSAFVAALFALHPINVESVAWVAERKNLLCTFFALLTIRAYSHYVRRPGWKQYALVLFAFALGLMSKPMVVTLPFVLLLLDFWPLQRWLPDQAYPEIYRRRKVAKKRENAPVAGHHLWVKLILEKVPLFALAAVDSWITVHAQRLSSDLRSMDSLSFGVRLANAVVAYMGYLTKMVWPSNLAVFYPHPGSSLPTGLVISSSVGLIGLTVLLIWQARKFNYLGLGWLWYLGTLFPVIGIVQIGDQAMADRYAYIPLIGVFILIVWSIKEARDHYGWNGNGLAYAGVGVLFVMSLVTMQQLSHWKDSQSLFEHALISTKNNYVAHDNLGFALREQGRMEEAIDHFSKAVETNPNTNGVQRHNLVNAMLNLAVTLQESGRLGEATQIIRHALEMNPFSALAYNNLGSILSQQGKREEALAAYRRALELKPETRLLAEIHFNLGNLLTELGKGEEAADSYQKTLQWNPYNAQAEINLGALFYLQGKLDEAIPHYQNALRLKPDAGAYYLLGLALTDRGKLQEGLEYFKLALKVNPSHEKAQQRLKWAEEKLRMVSR